MSGIPQPVRGMNDVPPDEVGVWQHVERVVRATLEEYGYRELRFPVVERTELFARSIGEATDIVEKEMYTFEDRNGDSLTLRPEGTAVCVRAGLSNGLLHNQAPRLWYHGAMFRHERPQKGRYRQFHQFGAEAFGMIGPDVDAEVILLAARMWRRLGLDAVRLELNSLGDASDRAHYKARLVEHFTRHESALDEDARRRLRANPLRLLDSKDPALRELIAAAPNLIEHLGDEARAHFERLQEALTDCGVEFAVNPRLVRGLDYYNRTVFEFVTDRLGSQDAICSGGRYDGLVEQLGGAPTPAVGWAMGVERLVALVRDAGTAPVPNALDVYAVLVGADAERAGLPLVERLREAIPGLRIQMNAGGGGFKAQLKRADRSGARLALILGDDEVAHGTAALKRLRGTGEQETVRQDGLVERMVAALAAAD